VDKKFIPLNLEVLRKSRGLTKVALSKLIDADVRTITAWEKAEFLPSTESINLLANKMAIDASYFSLSGVELPRSDQVSFRAVSKLSARNRDMALAASSFAFKFASWLEDEFECPKFDVPDLRDVSDPSIAAYTLRSEWGLGNQPIDNMVHLLESKGVRVFSLSLEISDVDAFCLWKDKTPFVFLNTLKSHARRRFDAAHELGHLVMHRHGDYQGKTTEAEADQFASAFLMPEEGVLPTKPRILDLSSSINAKKVWGVSLAAYVVRMHKLNAITEYKYRSLFKQISMRGYRRHEPDDANVERSKIFELLLDALREDGLSLGQLCKTVGIHQNDLTSLMFGLATIPIPSGFEAVEGSIREKPVELSLAIDNTANNLDN